jgi:DNA-binding PadR family transcriptional regulator
MGTRDYLGGFEQVVLTAVLRLRGEGFGMAVRDEIEGRGERRVSLGATYATLDRLEDKGFLASREADPTPERGGRPRRYFEVTAAGVRALDASWKTLVSLRKGLKPNEAMR